jgi:hypothetical protein
MENCPTSFFLSPRWWGERIEVRGGKIIRLHSNNIKCEILMANPPIPACTSSLQTALLTVISPRSKLQRYDRPAQGSHCGMTALYFFPKCGFQEVMRVFKILKLESQGRSCRRSRLMRWNLALRYQPESKKFIHLIQHLSGIPICFSTACRLLLKEKV